MSFIWHSAAAAEAAVSPPPEQFKTWSVDPAVGKYPRPRDEITSAALFDHMEFAPSSAGFNEWSVEPKVGKYTRPQSDSTSAAVFAALAITSFVAWSVDHSSLPRPLQRLMILSTSSAAQPPTEAPPFELSVEPPKQFPQTRQPQNESWSFSPVAQPLTSMGWLSSAPPLKPSPRLMVLDFVDGAGPTAGTASFTELSVEWPKRATLPTKPLFNAEPIGSPITPAAGSSFVDWASSYARQALRSQPAETTGPLTPLLFGSGYPLSVESGRAFVSGRQPTSNQALGDPFPFAPAPFQTWTVEPPRVSKLYSGYRSVDLPSTPLSFGSGFPLSVEARPWKVVTKAPSSTTDPVAAPMTFAPMPFQTWVTGNTTGRSYRPFSESVVPHTPLTSFPLGQFQTWSVDSVTQGKSWGRRPDQPTVLSALFAPAPFQNWSVQSRLTSPAYKGYTDVTKPNGDPYTFAPTAFQTWAQDPKLTAPSYRGYSEVVGPLEFLIITPFQQWSVDPPVKGKTYRGYSEVAQVLPQIVIPPGQFQQWVVAPVKSGRIYRNFFESVVPQTPFNPAPPPAQFQTWVVEAGRWAWPKYRPTSTEALNATVPPTVSGFQQWSVEPARPKATVSKRAETTQVFSAFASVSRFIDWSGSRPRRYDPDRILAGNVVPLTPVSTGWFDLSIELEPSWTTKPPRSQTTQPETRLSFGSGFQLSVESGRWPIPKYRPVPQTEPLSAFTPPPAPSQFLTWSVEPRFRVHSWQHQLYPPTDLGPSLQLEVVVEVEPSAGGPAASIRVRHVPKPSILFGAKQPKEAEDNSPPFDVKVRHLPKPEILIGTKKPKS
jgi:hypothetical protein